MAHATSGPCLQQNLVCVLEGETDGRTSASPSSASARPSHEATRGDVSIAGLVREAALRALDDAGMTWSDIDAVVIGKAPDFFEGVMMPELYLADALGAVGKPMLRVHTAGSVGGSTAIVASSLVAVGHPRAGAHRRLREAVRVRGHVGPVAADPVLPAAGAPAPAATSPRTSAPTCAAPGAPTTSGSWWRSRTGRTRCKNPYAHLHEPDITFESIQDSMMLWDPIRYAETCPSSDGACAMVLADEADRRRQSQPGLDPRHVHALASRRCPPGRDHVNPQAGLDCAADVYQQAGITNPRKEIDVVEMYVPFSWFEPMWLENLGFAEPGEGWKLTEAGATAMDGDLPVNCSGGVLSTNPIGASGMLRFGEAAMQVRGRPASTRSTAPARPSVTPTAAARSSSPCGSSAPRSPDRQGAPSR